MNWIVLSSLLVFSTSMSIEVINKANQQNFGPYKIKFLKYETCKGPKRAECGTVHINNTHNMSDITFNFDFPNGCLVKNARITIGTIKNDNSTKKLWNYELNKPCQHFVLGSLIHKSFNLTNNCNIAKGRYEARINMIDLSRKFLGPSFFYDTFFFKVIAYNSASNFFCVYTDIKIFKL